jgi:hypothetical protein
MMIRDDFTVSYDEFDNKVLKPREQVKVITENPGLKAKVPEVVHVRNPLKDYSAEKDDEDGEDGEEEESEDDLSREDN